jgi:thiol-disulfide isomerase/thioredoxin
MKADEGVQVHLVGTNAGNEKKLADALKSGKPLFVKLYAEWCGACKNIQAAWNTLAKMKGITDAVHLVAIEEDARKILEQDKKYTALLEVAHYPTLFMVSPDGKRGEEMQVGENALVSMQTFITDYMKTMKGGGGSSRTIRKKGKKRSSSQKKGKRSSSKRSSSKRSSHKRSSHKRSSTKRSSSQKSKRGGSRLMSANYTINKLKGHRMSANNNRLNELKSQQPPGIYFTKELKQGDAAAKFITISLRGVPTGLE